MIRFFNILLFFNLLQEANRFNFCNYYPYVNISRYKIKINKMINEKLSLNGYLSTITRPTCKDRITAGIHNNFQGNFIVFINLLHIAVLS